MESRGHITILVEHQMQHAGEFLTAANIVWSHPSLYAPAANLLHTGTELLLKTFLLDKGCSSNGLRSHDLHELYRQCIQKDPRIENNTTHQALSWINGFGAKDGGVRYLRATSNTYAVPTNIFEMLTPLIDFVSNNVTPTRDITAQFG